MNPRTFGIALALSLSLAAAYPALAQEYDETAIMAAYEKAMTPGEHHAKLAQLEGNWAMTVTVWMQPGAEPTVSSATSTSKMVMGGRYMLDTVEGTAMGMPFTGMGWTGYDNVDQQYESTWIDNLGTGIYTYHGQWDDEVNGIVMHGSYADPVTGQKVESKTVTRLEGPDKMVYTSYERRKGDEEARKTMEIVSIRQ
ncbi:MAG: DUF1579 domain-containing protein [Gemmatimonadota bacterium]